MNYTDAVQLLDNTTTDARTTALLESAAEIIDSAYWPPAPPTTLKPQQNQHTLKPAA